MNTFLKTVALISAIGFPAAFIAQSLGANLPAAIDAAHMFGAFVTAFTLLTMFTDYAGAKARRISLKPSVCLTGSRRTALPLAA
jgi:hypothetical protein